MDKDFRLLSDEEVDALDFPAQMEYQAKKNARSKRAKESAEAGVKKDKPKEKKVAEVKKAIRKEEPKTESGTTEGGLIGSTVDKIKNRNNYLKKYD